jgi:hypothetical protein
MLSDNYVMTNKLINLRWIKAQLKNSLIKKIQQKNDWNNVFENKV